MGGNSWQKSHLKICIISCAVLLIIFGGELGAGNLILLMWVSVLCLHSASYEPMNSQNWQLVSPVTFNFNSADIVAVS